MPPTIKNNVIKSLIVYSKYIGCYEQFKASLKNYDIKPTRPDAFDAFLRMLNANDKNTLQWL